MKIQTSSSIKFAAKQSSITSDIHYHLHHGFQSFGQRSRTYRLRSHEYDIYPSPSSSLSLTSSGLTPRANGITDEAAFAVIKAAIESGCNYLNGGEFYGTPERNSLTLLRSYFEKYPEDASKVVINIKGGLGAHMVADGSKEGISRSIDNVLRMLGPVGRIDQFEAARKDTKVDYEKDTLGTIQEYIDAGKIGGISCSEVNATTLRNAVKAGYKIGALETELSLFTLDPLENGLLEACGELGITVLAYCESLSPFFHYSR